MLLKNLGGYFNWFLKVILRKQRLNQGTESAECASFSGPDKLV